MRPIELRFNGINSYSTEQSINFDKLTQYKVFGIVGKTGSGKTTILDAIILALYGKMPRYDGMKNARTFINNDMSECYVEFRFSIINNKKIDMYTVQRSFKVQKDSKVTQYKSNLIKSDENGENSEVLCSNKSTELDKLLLSIIGLTYEDFTRAVILPQGKFNEFLSLKNSEKGEMLGRIFSIEKYGDELTRKFNSYKRELDTEIGQLEAKVTVLTKDINIEELKKEITSLNDEKVSCIKEQEKLKKSIEQDKEALELLKEFFKTKKDLAILLQNNDEIELLEKNLEKYKNARIVKVKIDKQVELAKKLEEISKIEEKISSEAKKLLEEQKKISEEQRKFNEDKEANFQDIIVKLSKIEGFISENKDLEKDEKELLELEDKYRNLAKTKKQLDSQILENEKKLIKLSDDEKEYEKLIETNNVKYEYINIINKAINISDENSKVLENNKELTEQSLSIKKDLQALNGKLINLNNRKLELENILSAQKENKKMYYSQLLKKELEVGDICPICNTIIDTIDTEHDVQKEFDDNIEKFITDNIIEIGNINNKIEATNKELKLIETKILENSKNSNDLLLQLGKFKEEYNVADFKSEYTKIEKMQQNFQKFSEEIKLIRSQISEINKMLAQDKETKQNIVLEQENITAIGKNTREKVLLIQSKINDITKEQDLELFIKSLETKKTYYIDNEKIYEEKSIYFINEINSLNIKSTTNISNINNIKNSLKEIETDILESLLKFGFIDEADVLQYFVSEEDIFTYEQKIKTHNNSKLLLINNNDTLVEKLKLKDIAYEEINLNEFSDTLVSKQNNETLVSSKILTLTTEISNKSTLLDNAKEDLKKIGEFKKEINKLKSRLDNVNIITNLLSGNKFVQYIAKRYLTHICNDASKRLHLMSSGKYSIVQDETDFLIVDHYRGNIKRQVKSISGGEQFMVSLCLSLSLSTYISRKNSGNMNMFFLDEGFGSLDDETLDNVVDILFKASNDELSIGIITHVTKLQENLPKKVIVTVDPKTTSSVITIQ